MLARQPLQERPAQRGLSGSDIADDDGESLAALDPVEDLVQRILAPFVEIQEGGIGGEVECRFFQTIKFFIHRLSLSAPAYGNNTL